MRGDWGQRVPSGGVKGEAVLPLRKGVAQD